ncbi:transposase [Azospirillum sp. HJ39]|uniref:RNA-guided endonuclease InsQ/TnpB family protein n=1 Tax=Azospirillum sp. HJ39 TaxID=3159496 RepID=UPI0035592076
MRVIEAHRFRLYPTPVQEEFFRRTAGCCRVVWNLALEQRQTYGRRGRSISFKAQAAELKDLRREVEWLAEAPSHCLQQTLRDLDKAFARFFSGQAGYPRFKSKHRGEDSFRFPDRNKFEVGPDFVDLPKIGKVRMRAHRPVQGQVRNVTVSRDGDCWYASICVSLRRRVRQAPIGTAVGLDLGVAQPIVQSDGGAHDLPRVTPEEMRRKARLQKSLVRKKKGSRNRAKARQALARFEARLRRRRQDGLHKATAAIARSYRLVVVEDLKVRNMTASAAGTVDQPGVNVSAKAGLNRAMLDVAPGTVRRMLEYKVKRHGGKLVAVDPRYTSQTCSCCGRHPKDAPETAHLPHGRVSRDRFVCPLCSFACDADVNAARNILARGKLAINDNVDDLVVTAGGSPVAACGALGIGRAMRQESKKRQPSGLPKAA